MLSFLKNKVGRPSKKVLRKRRLFYLICALLIILFIAVGTYTLTSNTNTNSSFQAFDLDKLTGNVSNIGEEALNITYIDNVKNDSAAKNTTISIKEKFSYTGTDKIYYRLDLYQNNRSVKKGTCREVNNDKLATFSFKLTQDKLNVVTGIYSDSSCKKMLSKYRTKKYYIEQDSDSEETDKVESPSIKLPMYANTWYVGDSSEQFSVEVIPSSSTVTLTSSNPEIMEIVQYGANSFRLTAKKAGKVTITAKSSDEVDASVTYTVKEKKQISMTKFSDEWKVGAYGNAIVETSVTDSVQSVVSSNPTVIHVDKIDENIYKLTAKKVGTATITATSKNGAKKSYTYTVIETTSISIPDYNSVLTVGKTYGKFALSVTPKDSNVTLTSSNSSVIEVVKHGSNSFSLKAKKAGTATITAKSSDGAKKTYNYTVIEEAKDISMPKYPDEWNVGESYGKFSVLVSPSNATIQVTSSDSSVIEVVKNGTNSWTLKAKKAGTATITATSSNGLKTSYAYTVKQEATINMTKFSNELEVGKTYGKFTLTTNPTASYVTVSSSNPSVIQVMKYGDNSAQKNSWGLKAKKVGTATITATANNGAKVSYTYTVKEETKITMPKYKDEWVVGESYGKFSITVTPSNLSVTLTSSNSSVIEVVKHSSNSWTLKAKKAGTATITAKSSDGAITSYTYIVKEEAKVSIPNYPSEWETGTSSKEFSATVTPSNSAVSMTSSNSTVMEVINKGNNKWQLKAKKAGTATITVTTSAGAKATYTYTVKEKPTITMPKYEDELNVGTTYGKFSLETNTVGATVTLISSNPSVLQVIKHNTNSWSLKALKAGTAQVTATSSAGAQQTYSYKVVANKLIMSDSDLGKTLEYGDTRFLTVGSVSPSNSTVTVTSSNASVISVSTTKANVSWRLNAVGIGTATITVSSSNGKTKTYTCVVSEPKGQALINMQKFSSTLEEGTQTSEFRVGISPSSATVTVTSSNPDVIQVIKHGNNSSSGNRWSLKAKKAGTATITAKSSIGATQSYTYTVRKVASSISMTHYTYEYWTSGTKGVINVQVAPSNSTVTVTSSDPTVMRIKKISNTKWEMYAMGNGTSTITASATNGKKISYTYKVKHEYPNPANILKKGYTTENVGGVTVYIEKGCSTSAMNSYKTDIKNLADYAKKAAKVVYFMTDSTWGANGYSAGAAAHTWIGMPNSYVESRCSKYQRDVIVHEYGHAIDNLYNQVTGNGYISESKNYVSLFNTAYNYSKSSGCTTKSGKCSILRGYSYTTNHEFLADSYYVALYKSKNASLPSGYGQTFVRNVIDIDKAINNTISEIKKIIK